MANNTLGITFGGLADAEDSRRRLGEVSRRTDIAERGIQFQEDQAKRVADEKQQAGVLANIKELTSLAMELRKTGDPNAAPAIDLLKQRIVQTAETFGLNPDTFTLPFEAGLMTAQTPEQTARSEAGATVAGAEAIAEATGADSRDVLVARGFLPAEEEQFRVLDDAEKSALGLPKEAFAQVAPNGEVKIRDAQKNEVKFRQAEDTLNGQAVFVTDQQILASPERYVPLKTKPLVTIDNRGNEVGNPPKEMAWVMETLPSGERRVKTDDRGVPIALPIRGTKLDMAGGDAEKARIERERQRAIYTDVVTDDIERSIRTIAEADIPVTGVMGWLSSGIPGTDAFNLAKNLETVKANIGFNKLQEMREASPTGGALGQVSNFENRLMQATFGNLEQSQTADQLLFNLNRIRETYKKIVVAGMEPEDLSEGEFGEGPTGLNIGTVENFGKAKFMYMGGDPGIQSNWWSLK